MMESLRPSMTLLFEQLGLNSTPEGIAAFIASHRPLPDLTPLDCAVFWSESQSRFLRQELSDDADWAIVIDRLDAALRRPPVLTEHQWPVPDYL